MGFFDFLKKAGVVKAGGQTWKGDAQERPLDDPDQQQKMSELDREIKSATDNNPGDNSGSSDW
jgi:hypothetical protein